MGRKPAAIVINPDPAINKVYVANEGSNTVTFAENNLRIRDIPVGRYPSSIAVNPNTNKIYVVNAGEDSVSVIDGYTKHNIKVGRDPSSITVNPNTNIVYVANKASSTVSVIEGAF